MDLRAKELRNKETEIWFCQVGGWGGGTPVCLHSPGWGLPWTGVNCRFSLPQFPFHGSQFLHLSNEKTGWDQIPRSLPDVDVLKAWETCGWGSGFLLLCFPPPRDALAGGPEFQAGAQLLESSQQYTSRSFWYCIPLLFRGQELGRARGSGL